MDTITKEMVRQALTQDAFFRRQQKWPLFTYDQLYDMINSRGISKFRIQNELIYLGNAWINQHTKNINEKQQTIFGKIDYEVKYLLNKYHNKLILAGGALRFWIHFEKGLYTKPKDYDFFFVNISQFEAEKILSDIADYLEAKGYEHYMVIRNKYVTTIKYYLPIHGLPRGNITILQFVHRIYPSIDMVIGGFDIAQASIATNGDEIFMTPMAFFALSYNVEILNLSRRSTSYEHRLIKYMQRYNLKIILPGFSYNIVNKFPQIKLSKTQLKLPYLSLTYVGHNRFYINTTMIQDVTESSDYADTSSLAIQVFDVANIKYATINQCDHMFIYGKSYDKMNINIDFTPYTIKSMLKLLQRKSCKYIMYLFPDYYYDIIDCIKKNDTLIYNASDGYTCRIDKLEKLQQICNELNNRVVNNLMACSRKLKTIEWIVDNPGRQWTSSNNPIIENVRKWYNPNNSSTVFPVSIIKDEKETNYKNGDIIHAKEIREINEQVDLYEPFHVLIPEAIETILRLGRKDRNCYISLLPNDVFNMLLICVAELYALDGLNMIAGNNKTTNVNGKLNSRVDNKIDGKKMPKYYDKNIIALDDIVENKPIVKSVNYDFTEILDQLKTNPKLLDAVKQLLTESLS